MDEYIPYILIAVGLAAIVFSIFQKSTQKNLKDSGIPVEGIIFSQEVGNNHHSFDSYARYVKDKITVRFVTQSGEWITEDIKQDFGVFYSGQYKNGDQVKVYYNKDNPKDFYVDTKQSEFMGKLVFALVGVVLISIGLIQLFIS